MADLLQKRSTGTLARAYRDEGRLFRREYARILAIATLALVVGTMAGFLYFQAHPDKAGQALSSLNKIVMAKVSRTATGAGLAWAIFWNNLRASLIALALGLLPFLCLS